MLLKGKETIIAQPWQGILIKHTKWNEKEINEFVYNLAIESDDNEAKDRAKKERVEKEQTENLEYLNLLKLLDVLRKLLQKYLVGLE